MSWLPYVCLCLLLAGVVGILCGIYTWYTVSCVYHVGWWLTDCHMFVSIVMCICLIVWHTVSTIPPYTHSLPITPIDWLALLPYYMVCLVSPAWVIGWLDLLTQVYKSGWLIYWLEFFTICQLCRHKLTRWFFFVSICESMSTSDWFAVSR